MDYDRHIFHIFIGEDDLKVRKILVASDYALIHIYPTPKITVAIICPNLFSST